MHGAYRFGQVALLLIATTLVVYGPAISLTYGRQDDYVMLAQTLGYAPNSLAEVWVGAGRLAPAVIGTWLFSYVDSVTGLVSLRLLAAVVLATGGAIIAVMTLRLLGRRPMPVDYILSCAAGAVFVATPAAASAATWAAMSSQLLAFPLALGAGVLAIGRTRLQGIRWEAWSGGLILLAAFTYQPAVASALLPIFMWSAREWAASGAILWGRPLKIVLMVASALSVNLIFVTLSNGAGGDRLGDDSLSDSVVWLVGEYLPRSADYAVPSAPHSATLWFLAATTALATPILVNVRYAALSLSVLFVWLASSCVVAPGELWATYRLIMGPQAVLWCGAAACCAFTISHCYRDRRKVAVGLTFVLCSITLGLLGIAGWRAYAYLAKPNAVDWASVRCVVAGAGPYTSATKLELTPTTDVASQVVAYDEYGVIASATPWALPSIAWLAWVDTNEHHLPPAVTPAEMQVVDRSSRPPSSNNLRFDQDVCGALER